MKGTFRHYPIDDQRSNPLVQKWNAAICNEGWSTSLKGRPSILFVHWPFAALSHSSVLVAGLKTSIRLLWFTVLRCRGTRLVYVVHNELAHDPRSKLVARVSFGAFHHLCSGFVFLSKVSRDLFPNQRLLGRRRVLVTVHGPYEVGEVHRQHEDGRSSVGYFGRIEPYKGVDRLISLASSPVLSDVSFRIWGQCRDQGLGEELRARKGDNVDLRIGWLEESQVRSLGAQVDLFVLPFREITNSGSVIMALELGRPVAVTDSPSMRELSERLGSEWIYLIPAEPSAHDVLLALRQSKEQSRLYRDLQERLGTWLSIGQATSQLFEDVLSRRS